MNKTSNDSTTVSLHQTFWRWFSFSVLALMVAAAIPALSADVFIDEGDGDFAPTPVTSPAPASVAEVPPANPAADIDSAIDSLQPAEDAMPAMGDAAPALESAPVVDAAPIDAPLAAPVAVDDVKKESKKVSSKANKSKKNSAKASKDSKKDSKKKHLQVVKSSKSKKEKSASKSKAGKDKKKAVAKTKKSKKKSLGDSSKASKRGVASVKYAGGKYATTSRACPMESAPGAGDAIGTTVSGRNLWVEEAGNTSYWKVYGKSGAAAFVARDCF